MKKLMTLALVSILSASLFSQVLQKKFVATASGSDGVDSIWMNGDSINMVTEHFLINGKEFRPTGFIYNVLESYDPDQRQADGNDNYMFIDAFSKSNVILIPAEVPWDVNPGEAQYIISNSTVEIPFLTDLIFEPQAVIDVQAPGKLEGNYTFIDAGLTKIFTLTSNLSMDDYDWASSNVARPEWFGALPFGIFDNTEEIQKTIDVFKRNIFLEGAAYRIEGTIELNSYNTLKISPLSAIIVDAGEDPVFRVTKEPFVVEGGIIAVEENYTGWIFDVEIDKSDPNDRLPRFTSKISDIIIRGFDQSGDYSGQAVKGIKLESAKESDYSYFSVVDNVNIFRSDTAIYIRGNPNFQGMTNSWHWSNITLDGTMKGIILDNDAAGHVFSSLIIQPNTFLQQFEESFIIDVNSSYNVFSGMIWDVQPGQRVIRLGPDASHNWFNNFGRYNLYENHVTDEADEKGLNTISTSNPFETTTPAAYNYFTESSLSIGNGGVETARQAGPLTVTRDVSITKDPPAVGVITKAINTGGPLNVLTGTNRALSVVTVKSNGTTINRGHGGGIEFLSKHLGSDTTTPSQYTNNIMARLYARKDANGADNDDNGLFQIFTVGDNATLPTMTLRNSGNVGIGTTEPEELLHVAGNLKVDGTITSNAPTPVMSTNTMTINEVLTLKPLAAPPEDPEEGTIYINSTDSNIYYFINGNWKKLNN